MAAPEHLGPRHGCPGVTGASKWLPRSHWVLGMAAPGPLGLRNGCPRSHWGVEVTVPGASERSQSTAGLEPLLRRNGFSGSHRGLGMAATEPLGFEMAAPEHLGPRHGCPGATGVSKWLPRSHWVLGMAALGPLGLRNGCPRSHWDVEVVAPGASERSQSHWCVGTAAPEPLVRRNGFSGSHRGLGMAAPRAAGASKLLLFAPASLEVCVRESIRRSSSIPLSVTQSGLFKDASKEAVQVHSAQISKILFSWLRAWLCTGSH